MTDAKTEEAYRGVRLWALEGIAVARRALDRGDPEAALTTVIAQRLLRMDEEVLACLGAVLLVELAKLQGGTGGQSSDGTGLEGQSTGAGGP